jgi:hypothetical protein
VAASGSPEPGYGTRETEGQRLDLLLGTHDRTPRHLSPGRSQRANTIPSVLLRLEAVAAEGYEHKMLPSASLSEGVVFVSLFRSGYQVWEMAC